MNLSIYDIIQNPLITEKGTLIAKKHNQYLFRVHPKSTKRQVKEAVEKVFNVHVTKVRTLNVLGKMKRVRYALGRTANWKKAVVTLKSGDKIDFTS